MKKLVIAALVLAGMYIILTGGAVQAEERARVNAAKGIEVIIEAESTGALTVRGANGKDSITVRLNGDADYEVYYEADKAEPIKPDKYLEVATELIGEHEIFIKKDNHVYVVFVDGVMSTPYIGESAASMDLTEAELTATGGVKVVSICEGARIENETNGLMTTAVNGELDLMRNQDGSMGIRIADKRYTNGAIGDGYGQKGARNRIVVTEPFDVTRAIVFYAKSSHDVYGFGFGKSKYDLQIGAAGNTFPLGIQSFPVGGITYIQEAGRADTCAYRNGAGNGPDKFVIEIGEASTKITVNDASFWGVYENVQWKRSDFPEGKAYLMFSFFSNGTTQGATQELSFSLEEPMRCEDGIKNYYFGEGTELSWQYSRLPYDKVELRYGEEVLGEKDSSYDVQTQVLTIHEKCLERIFRGSAYRLQKIQVCDREDGFVYTNLKIMLKRPVDLPEDNNFANSEAEIEKAGFFSEPSNVFFVAAICVSALIVGIGMPIIYHKLWRKTK